MLSIIVPVYNAKMYLERCVRSILGQTIADIEIILVDDGSKDGSGEICDIFCEQDKRVKVIHKLNGGVSSARNAGLNIASGEYVMFVDSDDWISNNLCKKMLLHIGEVDLGIGGYTIINKNGESEELLAEEELEFPRQFGIRFDQLYKKNFINAPFAKIYKMNIIGEQRFDTSVALGEDFLFNLEYLSKCKKIKIVNTSGYMYNCMNENSATKKMRETDIEQVCSLYQKGKYFLHKYCPEVENSKELKKRFCLNGINLIQMICYTSKAQSEKKVLAQELLLNKDFIEVCKERYDLPFKYDLPRRLCKKGKWRELQRFFWIKEKMSYMRG